MISDPTRMLLIRHGDSHHRYDGVYGGPRGCRGLTDLGRSQARRLSDRLQATGVFEELVAIYSSIIPRAAETAEITVTRIGLDVVQDCGLCSYHLDERLDGMRWDDIHRDHELPDGGVFLPFQADSESWSDLVNRVSKALTVIAARHPGQTVIVVAHNEVVEASLISFGSLPIYRNFDVRLAATSITEWITGDDPSAE